MKPVAPSETGRQEDYVDSPAIHSGVHRYPLTPMQSAMLFHGLSAPNTGAYIDQITCDLRHALNPGLLERAWGLVIGRHDVLHTRFDLDHDGEPVQEVCETAALTLAREDWSHLEAGARETRYDAELERDRHVHLDPSRAPVMRVKVYRLAETRHRLLWTYHHALLDGRSARIVLQEVLDAYDGLAAGTDLRPVPRRPFRDYVAWLERQDTAAAEAYWSSELQGMTCTPLPCDAPHASERGEPRMRTVETELSRQVTHQLEALARRHGITLNTVVQGAWAQLLGRYSGERDVVFGATRALRGVHLEGIRDMVGLFINTVPMRVRIDPEQDLRHWLKALRAQWVAMRPFEFAPLKDIARWSGSAPGAPLFSSVVVFENDPLDWHMHQVLEQPASRTFSNRSTTNYPLTILALGKPTLTLKFRFDALVISEAAVRRMLGHFKNLLESAAAGPARPLKEFSMLGAAEQRQLVDWNRTEHVFPGADLVHRLFERQAARTPEAPAVVTEAGHLSYTELNQQANRLAHRLLTLGVRRGVLVGVCLDHSPEFLVSILAVLKCGAAYLPLDADYPKERLDYIIGDARPVLLITKSTLAPRTGLPRGRVVELDRDEDRIAGEACTNLPGDADASSAAYAVYTSGSTGRPKGILVPHRALTNHTLEIVDTYRITAADRRLQFASVGADVLIAEVFPYLASGATVCVRPAAGFASIRAFLQFVDDMQITVVGLPSEFWHEWVHAVSADALPVPTSLRVVVSGMDRVRSDLFAKWVENLPRSIRWFNAYGPTEATCTTTRYEAGAAGREPPDPVPIGRPIANVRVHLLDEDRQPVAVGVPGEIHIGGAGLALGYINQPELTAQNFVPDPFSEDPEDRLYKTGDLGRYRDDGNLIFLGRNDHQVKIRGHRVDLGEIEAALDGEAAVRRALVMHREDEPGKKLLVAYIQMAPGSGPDVDRWRDTLRRRLPGYMIPAVFVQVEAWPLNPHGKVDRARLPRPQAPGVPAESGRRLPTTPTERALARIWASALKLDRVGVNDSFFELGGDSLIALRVCGRVTEMTGVALPPDALYQHQTIARLARAIDLDGSAKNLRRCDASASSRRGTITPASRSDALPLSSYQEDVIARFASDPGAQINNRQYALEMKGALNPDALIRSFRGIVSRHEILRTSYRDEANGWRQVIHAPQDFAVQYVDLSGVPDVAARVAQCMREAHRPLNLYTELPLRVVLVRLPDASNVLLLALHHIAYDGTGLEIFWREVSALYQAEIGGGAADLPELPVQYADYAAWQRDRLAHLPDYDSQLEYWRSQLRGMRSVSFLRLPPHRTSSGSDGGTVTADIHAQTVRKIRDLASRFRIPVFPILLAAYKVTIHEFSFETELVVGMHADRRTVTELENVIGLFSDFMLIRTSVEDDPTFEVYVRRVHDTISRSLDNLDIPFSEMRRKLKREGIKFRFPALFQFIPHAPGAGLTLADVEIGPFHAHGAVRSTPAAQPVQVEDASYDGTDRAGDGDSSQRVRYKPLELGIQPLGTALHTWWHYDTRVLNADMAGELSGYFVDLLNCTVDDPARPLSAILAAARGES